MKQTNITTKYLLGGIPRRKRGEPSPDGSAKKILQDCGTELGEGIFA
jgi:hypothetical protein